MKNDNPDMGKFMDAFFDHMQSMDITYAAYAKHKGLTYMSITTLEYIFNHPEGCTQKEIVEETFFPKQSVSLIIKGFVKQGYVMLMELEHDRRNKQVMLTATGKQFAESVFKPVYESMDSAAEKLSQKERKVILESMRHFDEKFREALFRQMN